MEESQLPYWEYNKGTPLGASPFLGTFVVFLFVFCIFGNCFYSKTTDFSRTLELHTLIFEVVYIIKKMVIQACLITTN